MFFASPIFSRLLRGSTLVVTALTAILVGCDSNDDSKTHVPGPTSEPTVAPTPIQTILTGAAVDGPIANAVVRLYRLDTNAASLQGELLDEGETDAHAQFSGLEMDVGETGPFLIVVTADEDTVDLNTGNPPIISEVRTVLMADRVNSPVYATPLTTMAVSLAVAKADDDQTVTLEEFTDGLEAAADEVVSVLGFGMGEEVDIFAAPPMVTDATDTDEELRQVAQYRTAISGAAAVIFEIQRNSESTTADAVMAGLADDLSDGTIDGKNSEQAELTQYRGDDAAIIVETDPSKLIIPGTDKTVEETEELLDEETSQTGTRTDTSRLADGSVQSTAQPGEIDTDRDDDGVLNAEDEFPNDPNEFLDTDGDGVGNNADPDDDNDGSRDANDAFPLDSAEKIDTDGDGIGNAADTDDDGDGVADSDDDFPLDATASDASDADGDGWPTGQDPNDDAADVPGIPFVDSDGDGKGNSIDNDDDNDGVIDEEDDLPLDSTEAVDSDGDGFGDGKDDDIDGDGVPNHSDGDTVINTPKTRATGADAFAFDASESRDMDKDGVGDNADSDADGDGLADVNDPDATKKDTDGDGVRDGADALPADPAETLDSDKDGVGNNGDNCRFSKNTNQMDTDNDGQGNACDTDDDGDGVVDGDDDFPLDASAFEASDVDNDGWPVGQDPDDGDAGNPGATYVDSDGDGAADSGGLAPDIDDDNDGVNDVDDAFAIDPTEYADADQDGTGDIADLDDDNDGVDDVVDAYPHDAARSADADGDGVDDSKDNCPSKAGPQTDTDQDGSGNVCDTDDDNDGIADGADKFPLNSSEWLDTDGDGIGNIADTDDDGDGVSDEQERIDGTDFLHRDSDRDGTTDGSDNCPLVANADQVDSDENGVGNLCDNPPMVAGYYLFDMTVSMAEGECEQGLGDVSAEVGLISQMNTEFKLHFSEDEFRGDDAGRGTINALGQVVIEEHDTYPTADNRVEEMSLLFLGLRDSATGAIHGSVEEARKLLDSDGSEASYCHSKMDIVMTPMPEVPASTVLDADGSDGGLFTSGSESVFDENGSRWQGFWYNLLNTQADANYYWDDTQGDWVVDGEGEGGLVLSSSGWLQSAAHMQVAISGESATVTRESTGGVVLNSWVVQVYELDGSGKPMANLVDREWVREGLIDPMVSFADGVNVIAVMAARQQDEYEVYCDEAGWAAVSLDCSNWMAASWADPMDQNAPVLATSLADILHTESSIMTQFYQGVWVAHDPFSNADIRAYLTGSDTSGAEGSVGTVTFFHSDWDNGLSAVTDSRGAVVTGTWSISDPMDNDQDLILAFDLPDMIEQAYDSEGSGGASSIILAVVADTSDGVGYVRTGRKLPAGEMFRAAGLNAAGAAAVLANFDYVAPTPAPEPSTEPTPVPTGDPSEPTDPTDPDPSGEPSPVPTSSPSQAPTGAPSPDPVGDRDGDGIDDAIDNCELVSNPLQEDTGGEAGLGDACDVAVSEIFGLYLAQLSFTADSTEYDWETGSCSAAEPAVFFLETHTKGNQVYMAVRGEADKLAAVMDTENKFLLLGEDSFSGEGTYNPTENSFGFTFSEVTMDDTGSVQCASQGSVTATGPDTSVVEQTVLSAGVTWLEGDSYDTDGDGVADEPWFEYGTIKAGALEVLTEWDSNTRAWGVVDAAERGTEHFLSSEGLVSADDVIVIDGYLDSANGQTAIVKLTNAGTAVDYKSMRVDLESFDVEGVPVLAVVPDFEPGLSDALIFSGGAVAYMGHLASTADSYSFWCDDDYDDWFASNLNCDNIVPVDWVDDGSGTGNMNPVPAQSLDSIINTTAEFNAGTVKGTLWIGRGYEPAGEFEVMAVLVSANGVASDTTITVEFIKRWYDVDELLLLGSAEVDAMTIGGIPTLSFMVPDQVMMLSDDGMESSHRLVFEESSIEGDVYVRTGEVSKAGDAETFILLNATALADVVDNFSL